MQINADEMRKFYKQLPERIFQIRSQKGKPLTLTEKILFSHAKTFVDVLSPVRLSVNHIAMGDASAQVALLQFPWCGEKTSAVSTSVHCDHLIIAENGIEQDLIRAQEENGEIISFLQSVSEKYGIGFWKPGSGIIHHQLFEHYVFPSGIMLATDSYASYAGGLGMLAFEGTGVDVLDLMSGSTFEINFPRLIGVHLTGELQGWASAKDLALKLIRILTASGGKGAIIEYFGKGAETISCSGKALLCAMGAETGALSSIFPYDSSMANFLIWTGRDEIAMFANQMQEHLQADLEVYKDPKAHYDQVIEIDLSTVEPEIGGPLASDNARPLSELSALTFQHGYPEKISVALIGHTNASYEDLKKAALIGKQALKHGLKAKIPLLISPGSEQIKSRLVQEGLWKILENVGAQHFVGAHGTNEKQWKRHDIPFGERNSILTTYNRTSLGLYDGNPGTHSFIASPEIVMALALAGSLNFNPLEDTLLSPQGLPVRLNVLIKEKFALDNSQIKFFEKLDFEGFVPPAGDPSSVQIAIDPSSERLQMLEPFRSTSEKDFVDLRPLIKVSGKCSIAQISPGGKWLKYRSHLGNLSNNLFSLVPNEFRDEIGRGKNLLSGNIESLGKIAKDYQKEGIGWIVIASENYGEGSYNDHAALSMRFLGGRAVIAQSIDPMHEMILKKQGILVLTFAWPENGNRIREDDLIDLLGIQEMVVNDPLQLLLKHADGTTERLKLNHSYTEEQIAWFRAGNFLYQARS